MYKYNSLLIYTIKLGKEFKSWKWKKKKKSSDKFDWKLALSTRCRETTCRLGCADLFLCVCQVNPELASCDLNCDLWTALRWMVFAAQPYTVVFPFLPVFRYENPSFFFSTFVSCFVNFQKKRDCRCFQWCYKILSNPDKLYLIGRENKHNVLTMTVFKFPCSIGGKKRTIISLI